LRRPLFSFTGPPTFSTEKVSLLYTVQSFSMGPATSLILKVSLWHNLRDPKTSVKEKVSFCRGEFIATSSPISLLSKVKKVFHRRSSSGSFPAYRVSKFIAPFSFRVPSISSAQSSNHQRTFMLRNSGFIIIHLVRLSL
jgi:hypothetical protein